MDREKGVGLLNRIKLVGLEQGVDFADPANAYMVWADLSNGVQFCGGRLTRESANRLAYEHTRLTSLYVVRAHPPAIEPVDDRNRIHQKS